MCAPRITHSVRRQLTQTRMPTWQRNDTRITFNTVEPCGAKGQLSCWLTERKPFVFFLFFVCLFFVLFFFFVFFLFCFGFVCLFFFLLLFFCFFWYDCLWIDWNHKQMKEGRKPQYPEKTHVDATRKCMKSYSFNDCALTETNRWRRDGNRSTPRKCHALKPLHSSPDSDLEPALQHWWEVSRREKGSWILHHTLSSWSVFTVEF